ncbi:MAG: Bacillithiol biosynthesis BshC [Acidobacteria bacterium]|nr:Bacillithiol biosynthesis BshC [Acidobacteriota bacterium]
MLNPSLRELPGFPSPYLGFLEGISEPGHIPPNRPEKGPLLSRCGAASRQTPPPAVIFELARKVAPTASGSCLWSENIEKLERHRAVVIGASADAAGFNASLLPLLKCLTAVRLAAEISLDGVSAVPLLWLDTAHRPQVDKEKEDGKVGPVQASSGQPRESRGNLVGYINNLSKVSTNIDLYPNGCCEVIMRLVHELGLVVIDSASTGFVLNHAPELSELRQRVIRICRQESAGQTVDDEPGCDPVIPGQTSAAVLLRLALPLGAEVVGPEDYDTAVQVGNLVGSAGNAKPFLWPRVSATVVDRRSCRTMEKYRLELPDLFRDSGSILQALSRRIDVWDLKHQLIAGLD